MATTRLIVISVTILVSTCSVGVTHEPLAARRRLRDSASDSATTLRLAKMGFPLRSQRTFVADLSLLCDVLGAKIRHPTPYQYPGGHVLNRELEDVFELISLWPCEKLQQPLVRHYKSSRVYVIESARALIAYRDATLREVVRTRSGYERTGQVGCFCYVETIDKLLKQKPPVQSSFKPLDALLPSKKQREILPNGCWPEGMTVPQAVSQLADKNLSVRLQSWAWLAQKGIIAPTDAVKECWPRLTPGAMGGLSALAIAGSC